MKKNIIGGWQPNDGAIKPPPPTTGSNAVKVKEYNREEIISLAKIRKDAVEATLWRIGERIAELKASGELSPEAHKKICGYLNDIAKEYGVK